MTRVGQLGPAWTDLTIHDPGWTIDQVRLFATSRLPGTASAVTSNHLVLDDIRIERPRHVLAARSDPSFGPLLQRLWDDLSDEGAPASKGTAP